jgi:peptidoglycan/xylan/chitin deacetylase (PgdA/CDA1 family)
MGGEIKSIFRDLLCRVGLIGLFHRLRNKNTLTVFMFHRVLPAESLEFARAEREFTFTVSGFARCLDFIKKHYNVIPHSIIREHLDTGKPLPERAGLITFDDGWRDTLVHALPELRKRSLPAVLFLATEVMDLSKDRWWQDMLVETLIAPQNLEKLERALGLNAGLLKTNAERRRCLTSAFAEISDERRHALLIEHGASDVVSRQMLNKTDINILKINMAIAGHGHSHAPLTHHSNACADLTTSQAKLQEIGADAWAMSFPHGDFDQATFTDARKSGFEVCYSSEPKLTSISSGLATEIPIGRIHIPENEWTCKGGVISASRLATFLFLRPIAKL